MTVATIDETGIRKAAILLVQLGQEKAAKVYEEEEVPRGTTEPERGSA